MTKAAKYLISMLTIVLIIALIGVAFAWYTANTTVTATSSATAAEIENASLSFVFTDGDVKPIYLSDARLLTDFYGRRTYTGEEGYSAALGGMVGNKTGANGQLLMPDAAEALTDAERLGTRDHVFTLFYLVELQGKTTTFNLKLDAVKIYKNGVSVRNAASATKENSATETAEVEYPVVADVENTVAKVSVTKGADVKIYYFDVTQPTTTAGVYGELDATTGTLSEPVEETTEDGQVVAASYNAETYELTCAPFGTPTTYVLYGHEADKDTKTARYFKYDDSEKATETQAVGNFTFNYYAVADGTDLTTLRVYNKAHEGDYNLYDAAGATTPYAEPAEKITTGAEGSTTTTKVIVGITFFAPITPTTVTAVKAVFPYSSLEYMKAHFKFSIKAGLAS